MGEEHRLLAVLLSLLLIVAVVVHRPSRPSASGLDPEVVHVIV